MTSTTTPFAWLRPVPLSFLVLALLPAGAARAQTPASFGAATSYATGATTIPRGVAVGDVNSDGRPDIVTANQPAHEVGVLLGQAGGGFAAVSSYSTGANSFPQSVAIGDVNSDGRSDIVTGNYGGGTVGVLLGQAGGGFAAMVPYSANGAPKSVAVADVNGDGRPDIVTANAVSTVGVLLGQAGGTFASVSSYSTGAYNNNQGVAVADLNNDGRPDIVTINPNPTAYTASVLLGQAGGGFAAVSAYSIGASSAPSCVAVADVNGDGRPDIITGNNGNDTAGVLLGQASGGFAPVSLYSIGANSSPNGIAMGDVNGDGRPDIVTGNYNGTASVLLGQAGGTFAPVSIFSTGVGSSNQGVAVADVSGDRRPDIVTTSGNSVSVLLNTGTFAPLAAAASAAAAEVALFPNPAQSSFTVQLPAAWGAGSVQATLLNALGQVVGQQTAALRAGAPLAFATGGLAPGVYQVRMQAGSHAITKRVVIK